MKIEVTQENLNKSLSAVSRIASTRGQMPILADILLKTDDGQLVISSTNLEVSIIEKVSAKIDEEGQVAIPARLFADFVNNLPHIPVLIESDDQKTKISAGGFASIINGGDPEEFPALPDVVNAKEFKIPADLLRESISSVAPVASNDTARPILTGIYLYSADGNLTMAATDGYRLAEKELMKIDSEIQAIIPATTLMEVLRLINDGIKEILVRINDEQISFGIGSIGLTSRLIDGKFIDYKQLIPTEADFTVTVDRNEFIRVVKVASIFAHSSAGSIVVKTSGENQELSVVTPASELGENNSSIEAEISGGNDGTISLNSKYLLDALNFIPSDKVNMRFSGKLSPVLLTGEKNDYNHIIMPVKY